MATSVRHHGCGTWRACAAAVCVVLMVMTRVDLGAVTPPGTIVTNYAAITLTNPTGTLSVYQSNLAAFEVAAPPTTETTAELRAFRVDAEAADSMPVYPVVFVDASGSAIPTGPASSDPGSASPAAMTPQNIRYREASSFRPGEFLLLRVADGDQNSDAAIIDTISVRLASTDGLETEIVQMRETGTNTGVFSALILLESSAVRAFDGRVEVQRDSALQVVYADSSHSHDSRQINILIDPFGKIFDSSTGSSLDGIAVTLIDDETHAPADVFGDDEVSHFPSTVVTGSTVRDSSGNIYALGPGKFVFPFVRAGHFHYQVALPASAGFTFPSNASDNALRVLHNPAFAIVAGSRGESFSVAHDPVEIDVPLDPDSSTLVLNMAVRENDAATGDFIKYDLDLTNRRAVFPFVSLALDDVLPPGARLEAKSVRIDGVAAPPSIAADGRTLKFSLPDLEAGKTLHVTFVAQLATTASGRATNTAVAISGTLRSNTATAALLVRDELMSDRAHILGRVLRPREGGQPPEGIANVAVFLETGTMVVTDERGFFHIEGVMPGSHVVHLDTTTLPKGATAASASTNRARDSAWTRFVDLAPGTTWNVEFAVALTEPTATANAPPPASTPTTDSFPKMNLEWLDAQPASQDWVLPRTDDSPDMPAIRILVKHFPAQKLKALINGQPVDPVNFDGTFTNSAKTMAISIWGGVNLVEGDNVLEIVGTDMFGIERRHDRRIVHFASAPVRAEIDTAASVLVADGVTPPVIALRLFDRDNHRARRGTTGRLFVHDPHAVLRADGTPNLRLTPGAAVEADTYTIGDDGLARIKLQPVTTSGVVRVTLALASGEKEIQASLRADRKDWMLVGIAEGSSAYRTVSGNLENAATDSADDGWEEDGRVAFFAKGRIRGGWLLTAAYDSSKEAAKPRSLHGKIDPDAYYTVYGDESQRLENADSSSKLYVRLERDAVTALFGDFKLDWSAKSFSSYVRDLHGAKVEYRGERVRASAFISDAGLTGKRDEIRGNGLSGPYQLSQSNVVPFSEKVVIEERDPLRPEVVLVEKPLARNSDYTIDYVGGAMRLSAPLFATTVDSHAMFLVVRYEMEDATAGIVRGARVEYQPMAGVTVGVARVEESHDGRSDSITGVDARGTIGKSITASAEISQSENATGSASAYNLEVEHHSDNDDIRAYFRQAGVGFGLGQLDAARTGTRQIGEEGAFKPGSRLTIRELLFRETSLATGDQRDAGELRFEYASGSWTLHAGARAARDTVAGRPSDQSFLLTAGAARRLFSDRLELRVDRETSLAGDAKNADLPERTAVNATFKIDDNTSVLAGQEWTEAKGRKTSQTQLGVQTNPWSGGKISAGVAQSELNSPATTLVGGLNQTIKINDKLGFEGGFQQSRVVAGAAADSSSSGNTTASTPQPFHSVTGFSTLPQGEGSAGFVGVHWKPATVQYNVRGEISETAETRRESLVASAEAEAGHDVGVLWSLVAVRQASETADATISIDGRMGIAWRPADGGSIMLSRIDLTHDTTPGESLEGKPAPMNDNWKAIGNFHFNQSFGHELQASVHLGVKYGMSRIDDARFTGWTTCTGIEVRRNLGPNWDVGMQAGTLSSWRAGVHRTNLGVSIGRALARNFWGSLGFSYGGFRDTDFAAARYTSPGVFVRFRLRLDQESLAGLIRAIKED